MNADHSELLRLSPAEQLRIVEMLWDNLGSNTDAIPLPDWVTVEGRFRRMEEMLADAQLGLDSDSVWRKIDARWVERVRYHPLFDSDVIDAADWYDARADGLGDAFVENVRQTVH